MAYAIHDQYLDRKSGFHVIELRDEAKNQHLVQISVGDDRCPACGTVYPKLLGDIDPKAMAAGVIADLEKVREAQASYAEKHNLKVK